MTKNNHIADDAWQRAETAVERSYKSRQTVRRLGSTFRASMARLVALNQENSFAQKMEAAYTGRGSS